MEKDEREQKREFVIRELMEPGFIGNTSGEMVLEETKTKGRSRLNVRLKSEETLCIANVDAKRTDLLFFQKDAAKCMDKRVDHMIFESRGENRWRLHLIEMKSSVGEKTWKEVKGKFRASYLVAQAVAAMLEMNLSDAVMYTTFERVQFAFSDTMPVGRRGNLGRQLVRMKDEWDGGKFGLNFGRRIPFVHKPIPMTRNEDGVLVGELAET